MRSHLAGSLLRGRCETRGDGPGWVAGCGVSAVGCRPVGSGQSCDSVRLYRSE